MDALYFPHLSLPASTWVNPALLFFDRLGVIAPTGPDPRLFDRRMHELFGRDMAVAMYPLGPWNGGEEDERFAAYLLGIASTKPPTDRFERIHAGKLGDSYIASALIDRRLLVTVEGDWLEGPDWVVAHLMSYLALQMSADAGIQLITNERAASNIAAGARDARITSRRLRAVSQLLPVPPDTPIAEIDRFRERHRAELVGFREAVTALVTRDPLSSEGEERFEERIKDAVRVRDHLVGEMKASGWGDAAATFGIMAIQTAAAHLDHAPWTVGAGLLGLGIGAAQAATRGRRRARAVGSRMIYATHAVKRFPPTFSGALW